jgi:mRNA interferase MazF
MSNHTPGDVVLVNVPFTDLSQTKKRPATVLLACGADYLVAFMTSRLERAGREDVVLSPSVNNGLAVDSAVLITKLFAFHESLIVRRLGRLATVDHCTIVDRIIRLLGSTVNA